MRNDYLNAMAMVSMIVVFFVFGMSRAEASETINLLESTYEQVPK